MTSCNDPYRHAWAALAELQAYLHACSSELADPCSDPDAVERVIADLLPLLVALRAHVAAHQEPARAIPDRP